MNQQSTPESCPGCSCRSTPLARRPLLGLIAVTATGLLLWPLRALARTLAIKLDTLPALKQVGGYVIATVKDREILFIRDSQTSVRATTPFCSHKRFRLRYDVGARQIHCTNHGSRFDLAGQVLKGPARQPLSPVYPAQLDATTGRILVKVD